MHSLYKGHLPISGAFKILCKGGSKTNIEEFPAKLHTLVYYKSLSVIAKFIVPVSRLVPQNFPKVGGYVSGGVNNCIESPEKLTDGDLKQIVDVWNRKSHRIAI